MVAHAHEPTPDFEDQEARHELRGLRGFPFRNGGGGNGGNGDGFVKIVTTVTAGIIITLLATMFSGYESLLTGQAAMTVQVQELQTELRSVRSDLDATRKELESLRVDIASLPQKQR